MVRTRSLLLQTLAHCSLNLFNLSGRAGLTFPCQINNLNMRKKLIILFWLFLSISAFSQATTKNPGENKKHAWQVSVGIPWFPNEWSNEYSKEYWRGLSLSASYQRTLSRSFAIDVSYLYVYVNTYPDFINDKARLDEFVIGKPFNFYPWYKASTHALYSKFHYCFVHNKRWFWSMNVAVGALVSKSSSWHITNWIETQNGIVIAYTAKTNSATNSWPFYMPGMNLNYTLPGNFLIGIQTSMFRPIVDNSRKVIPSEQVPVGMYHLSAAIVFGKKF